MGYPNSSNTYSINEGEMFTDPQLASMTLSDLETKASSADMTPLAYLESRMASAKER